MYLKKLENERDKRGWTQQEVADKIGVTRPAYANYESGKRNPGYEISQKLADLFETTIDYLLGSNSKNSLLEETEEQANIRKAKERMKQTIDDHKFTNEESAKVLEKYHNKLFKD